MTLLGVHSPPWGKRKPQFQVEWFQITIPQRCDRRVLPWNKVFLHCVTIWELICQPLLPVWRHDEMQKKKRKTKSCAQTQKEWQRVLREILTRGYVLTLSSTFGENGQKRGHQAPFDLMQHNTTTLQSAHVAWQTQLLWQKQRLLYSFIILWPNCVKPPVSLSKFPSQ